MVRGGSGGSFVRQLHLALSREGSWSHRPGWPGQEEEEEEEEEVEPLALARTPGSPSEAEKSELGAEAAVAAAAAAAAAAEVAAVAAVGEGAAEAEAEAAALAHDIALEDDRMELEDEGDAMEEEEAGDAAASSRGPQPLVDDQGFQEGEEEIGLEEEGDRVAAAAASAPFPRRLPLEGAFGGGGGARGSVGGDGSPSPLLFSAGLGVPPLGGVASWLAQGQGGAPYAGPRGPHWKRGVKRPREEQSRGFTNGLEGNQFEPVQPAAPPRQAPQGPALPLPTLAPDEPSAFGLGRRMRLVPLGNRGPN